MDTNDMETAKIYYKIKESARNGDLTICNITRTTSKSKQKAIENLKNHSILSDHTKWYVQNSNENSFHISSHPVEIYRNSGKQDVIAVLWLFDSFTNHFGIISGQFIMKDYKVLHNIYDEIIKDTSSYFGNKFLEKKEYEKALNQFIAADDLSGFSKIPAEFSFNRIKELNSYKSKNDFIRGYSDGPSNPFPKPDPPAIFN